MIAKRMARDRPSPYDEGEAFFFRSAGACPPRSLECADAGEGLSLALREGKAFFFRGAGACPPRSPSARVAF